MKLRRHPCGAVLAIAVGAVWGCTSDAVRLAPPGSVNIYRDIWGVPHVYAEREEDGFWGIGLSGWDIAAGVLIVREAGGVVTDPLGTQTELETGDIVAAGPGLHPFMLEVTRRAFG